MSHPDYEVEAPPFHIPFSNEDAWKQWLERLYTGTAVPKKFSILTDGDATPDVAGAFNITTANTSPTTITDFDNGLEGQIIWVYFNDDNTIVDFTSTNLKAHRTTDWYPLTGDLMQCIKGPDGNWHCDVDNVTVILDTAETIISTASNVAAWTTVNNTTLNNVRASYAILNCNNYIREDAAAQSYSKTYLRTTGSGKGTTATTLANQAGTEGDGTNNHTDAGMNSMTVALDSSHDFDHYIAQTASSTDRLAEIFLIGYIR